MFIQEWSQLLIMRYYQNNIHNHCSWMQADTPSINMNLPLTQNQIQICGYAEQFISSNNPKSEQALKKFHWTDICAVITHPNISNNIITVCCSTLKLLVKYEKFLDDPMTVFKYLCEFYFQNLDPQQNPLANVTKAQELTQMVIKVIPSACLKQAQKQHLIQQFLKVLNTNIQKSVRILKILTLIAEEIEIQRINNQKFVGQLLLFLEKIIKQKSSQENIPFKLLVITQTIKLIQVILDLVNEQDEIQQNYVEQFLTNSKLAKNILEQIISEGSNGKQIITNDNQINEVKFKTLELYSSIWVYSLDDSIFLLFLSSLLHAPAKLVDFQAIIMEKIVVMLQRSVNNQIYYPYFHKNQQQITISLLSFLMPRQSYLQKIQKQPEYFVEILSDFCMEQQQELFETRVGSLLSALCLYIDGYMSFVGSLCIMMIKQFNGTVHTLPDVQGYIDTINLLWVCSDEQKIVTCVLVLCAISDQLQKRQDLLIPLRKQLFEMSYMFKYPDCQLPPILICRFMFLYAFNAYPGCLNVFLPYKDVKSVYESQLQACYTIMKRYYNKHKECKQYIDQIGETIIVSNELSPLLQTSIMTGQMTSKLQFQILQRLVLWMQSSIQMSDRIKQSKYANLISKLIERLEVVDYNQTEEAVFTYLQSLFKIALTKDGSDSEQFILEISVAFVKRFPSLEKSPQRLLTLVEMGFKIVERNNGVLNSCLDLFYQLTRYLPKQLVESLINIYLGCLQSQDREQDNWQCYYGLESCFIRLNELKAPAPHINVNNILVKTREYSKILVIKAYMAIYSIIIANPENRQNCECLQNRQLPEQIPPYENKPYCLYLLSMAPYLNMTFEYSNWYLHLILKLMKNQKQINSSIRKYEQMIYNNYQNHHQFIVHAYTISRNVLHPLLLKNIDIYNQFRKFWWKFPHRQQLMQILDQSTLEYITELCTQTTINYKVRKIYKVKPQQNNQQMQDELTTKTNTEMQ